MRFRDTLLNHVALIGTCEVLRLGIAIAFASDRWRPDSAAGIAMPIIASNPDTPTIGIQ